jgi:hypothetical protein
MGDEFEIGDHADPEPLLDGFETPSRLSISNTGLILSPSSCNAAPNARRVARASARNLAQLL